MLVPVKDERGNELIAIAFQPIYNIDMVKELRDALTEILEVCVAYKEPKEESDPYHLYLLINLIKEITKDIEGKNKYEEGDDDASVAEIQKLYNDTFDKKLPPCMRLTKLRLEMVKKCVNRFGRQSVDKVFEQVLQSPYLLGLNNYDFKIDFEWIFQPKNYENMLIQYNKQTQQSEEEKGGAQ